MLLILKAQNLFMPRVEHEFMHKAYVNEALLI